MLAISQSREQVPALCEALGAQKARPGKNEDDPPQGEITEIAPRVLLLGLSGQVVPQRYQWWLPGKNASLRAVAFTGDLLFDLAMYRKWTRAIAEKWQL